MPPDRRRAGFRRHEEQSSFAASTRYRAGGAEAFFAPRATRGASVMTPEVTARAQQLLAEPAGADGSRRRTGPQARYAPQGDPARTIDRARAALSRKSQRPNNAPVPQPPAATDKSTRAVDDAVAEMGTGCTRPDERVLAAFGLLNGAPTRFESCRDVPFGGVLCALPALAENGLFRHIHDCLKHVVRLLHHAARDRFVAHMALCRIKTAEQLQYQAPGEFGKLLGLDRVPEVRCLRHKLAALSVADGPEKWAGVLSRDWLEAAPELAGALLCGRARSSLSWQPDRAAQTLCLPTATLHARDHRLLGQRHPGPAVLRGRAADRPRAAGGACAATSCRVFSMTFPASRPRTNSRPTAIAHVS